MYRPGILRRVSAAFALLLLLFSTQADVYAKSHCSHHGLPSAQHHHAPAKQQHSGPCTCLGDCAGTIAAVVTPAGRIRLAASQVVDVDSPLSTPYSLLSTPKFLIPFSTAPPFSIS